MWCIGQADTFNRINTFYAYTVQDKPRNLPVLGCDTAFSMTEFGLNQPSGVLFRLFTINSLPYFWYIGLG